VGQWVFSETVNTEVEESGIDNGIWPRKYIIYTCFLLTGPFTRLAAVAFDLLGSGW